MWTITAQCGRDARKDAVSLAEDDYLRTLDAITDRLEKAKIPREAAARGEVMGKKEPKADNVDGKDDNPCEYHPHGE